MKSTRIFKGKTFAEIDWLTMKDLGASRKAISRYHNSEYHYWLSLDETQIAKTINNELCRIFPAEELEEDMEDEFMFAQYKIVEIENGVKTFEYDDIYDSYEDAKDVVKYYQKQDEEQGIETIYDIIEVEE